MNKEKKWTQIHILTTEKQILDEYKKENMLSSTAKAGVHAVLKLKQLTSPTNDTTKETTH